MKQGTIIIFLTDKNNNASYSLTNNVKQRMSKFNLDNFNNVEVVDLPQKLNSLDALRYCKTLSLYNNELYKNLIDNKIKNSVKRVQRFDKTQVSDILDNISRDTTLNVEVQ